MWDAAIKAEDGGGGGGGGGSKKDKAVILPERSGDFASKAYWDEFFAQRDAFEWYGEYKDFREKLRPHLNRRQSGTEDSEGPVEVLVVGCGTSELSVQLHDDGVGHITSIDFSETVVDGMREKNAVPRPTMTWLTMDVTRMDGFSDASFDVVVDKGTFDAVVSDDCLEAKAAGAAMLEEIARVLRPGGAYASITLGQSFVLDTLLRSKEGLGSGLWGGAEIHKCSTDSLFDSPYLPFLLVGERRQSGALNEAPRAALLHFHFDAGGRALPEPAAVTSLSEVQEEIRSAQMVHRHRFDLARLVPGRVLEENLWLSGGDDTPRYSLLILDAPAPEEVCQPCAVLIVPRGRERDPAFSSKEGLAGIAATARVCRIIAVRTCPGHRYHSVESVTNEIKAPLADFAPATAGGGPPSIPIMAVSSELGAGGRVIAEGCAKRGGRYVVEEEEDEESPQLVKRKEGEEEEEEEEQAGPRPQRLLRRLIFLKNPAVVQTEAVLQVKPTSGVVSKKGASAVELVPFRHSELRFDYHRCMIAGTWVAISPSSDAKGKVLVMGLGGGALPMALRAHHPQASITICEVDSEVLSLAKKWFCFQADELMKCVIQEGLAFARERAARVREQPGATFHSIFIDVDNKDLSVGMNSPPEGFVTESSLRLFLSLLSDGGVLAVNVAARSGTVLQRILEVACRVFPSGNVWHMRAGKDDGNSVVFCFAPSSAPLTDEEKEKTLKERLVRSAWGLFANVLQTLEPAVST
jgi:spermidine synthase/SAM-dependent methyltransferase